MATSAKTKTQKLIVSDSLAIKYRPQKIEDMIGNDTAKKILQGMFNRKKIPNTMLIHGGTGQGKTTMARMISRYVNCATNDACGECSSCKAGNANPDIQEMNMATERGIDEVRTLIQKSKLAPRFNKRIFILDELHQCFVGDTEVLMADGNLKQIKDITPVDKILGFDHVEEQLVICDVSKSHKISNTKILLDIFTEKGKITCTHDHKFWSASKKNYVRAIDLFKSELLQNSKGEYVKLKKAKISKDKQKNEPFVYDITVPKTSNFFVKTKDCDEDQFILVHNCTPQAKEAFLKPLEEPPQNTIWILCTTEPEKLTKTILGRCQKICVTAPTSKEMGMYLKSIAKKEGMTITTEHIPLLKYIVNAAMGHSRDALQMLETLININSSSSTISIPELEKVLISSSGGDLDKLSSHLLAAILDGEGQEAIKLIYQAGQQKEIMGVILKLKWLIDYKLNAWAGTMKFSPHINKLFEQKYKKEVNVTHLIKLLNTINDCEIKIKSVSGLDEKTYFSAKILNDMVAIVGE